MKRYCLALDLVDDEVMIGEYEKWHRQENSWPEISSSIKNAGILDMEIYRTGNRLFMIMDTSDDFDPNIKAAMDKNNEKVREWEELMWKYQQPLPWAGKGEKWVLMKQVYKLEP